MYPIRFLLILLFVGLQLSGSGQVLDMQFDSPLKNHSFSRSNVTSIAQDTTGFIWIGTENGLYSYDGYQLKNYHNLVTDSTSLVNDNIKKLFVDSNGDLWIATIYGFCVYDKTYDRFKQIAHENNFAGLESLQILSVAEDKEGDIFVATSNAIYKYDKDSGLFSVLYKMEAGFINEFIFDENSNIWIAAVEAGGLTFYNRLENKSEHFLHDDKNTNSISSNSIYDIVLQDNLLWIGTYGAGVNSFDLKTRKFKRYPLPDSYAGYTIETYVDRDNNLWTCDLTGIKLYDKQNDSFYGYYPYEDNQNSFKSGVVCLFQDRQGNYWAGYSPGGIERRTVPKGFEKYNNNPVKFWKTSDNNITAIEFDAIGNWWLGNGFNGIDVFDWQSGGVKTYHDDPSNPYSLGQGAVASLHCDQNYTMWVGTNFGGLQYYLEREDRFYSYVNNPNDDNSIAGNDIRSIVDDKKGDIWIAVHGKGIDRFDQKEGVFYHYNQAKNQLANDWAFQLLFDSEENLWVATSWGVSKLVKGAETFNNFYYLPNDSNTIPSNQVNCVFEDSKNQIWVGTSNGLCKFRPETNDFKRFHLKSIDGSINSIRDDNNGNLWISMNDQILRYNPETEDIIGFDKLDGLLGSFYHPRSVAKNSDGFIFFGGVDGMTVFNPQSLVFNNEIPKVVITGFTLFNQPETTYGEDAILQKHISETNRIELNYDQNTIGFVFVATNLINAEKNQFKYKLEGVDKEWINIGNKNDANYTQLQPGKYTFRVIASNNDNVWNNEGTSIKIVIYPPWWGTNWFKALVLVSILLLLYFIMRQRMAGLIRQKNELESKVLERTNVLSEKNELLKKRQFTIEQQSEELKLQAEELRVIAENIEEKNTELTQINATKDKLFSIIAHDLLNPFNIILGFSDTLIENFDTWDEEQKLEVLNYIKDSSGNAFNLLENLLHWSRSQKGMIEFTPGFVSILQIINSVLDEVSSFSIKKEVEIVNLFNDGSLKVFADENMLRLIGRNLLMNAIKFSNSPGKVYIEVDPDYKQSFVCFSIRDEGVGMEKEQSEGLFSSENNSSKRGTQGEKGVGLGLVLCSDFVLAHKGEIWVESEVGKGTTVFFTIPKAN